MEFVHGERIDVLKDGENQPETIYTIKRFEDQKNVQFTDQQDRRSGWARIKYMERAPGMGNSFPCCSGYRRMHFATEYDMSVEVPAAE
jgi:hypothetical protein